jgi:phenylalanyl-tRNA synthetase beta chain
MKVSLNWLTDYVDVASMPAGKLAAVLKQIGLPVEEVIETESDIVLDVEVTSNRGDCLGHLGIARELAAAMGLEFRRPAMKAVATDGRAEELTKVEVLDAELCPRYTARVIRGVKVGPSPRWMVERLEAVGLRGINNVVDATNYVLMEYSQPLHSFDYDKLDERRIVVRRAKAGEMLVSIDGTKCELDERMLVIADARRPVAIAGVMGGLNTEVGPETTNVLIESAQFQPLGIRRTSRKLMLMSESNYRFERGVDPVGLDEASLRACRLIVELGGGRLAEGVVDVWANPHTPKVVALRPGRTNAVLGIDVPVERQVDILRRLGLSPRLEGGRIVCEVPSRRRDLEREIDLIEEVARVNGLDAIPTRNRITMAVRPEDEATRIRKLLARELNAGGFDEAVTFGFIDDEEAKLLGHDRTVSVDKQTRKTNNVLRPALLPSLLRSCKVNQNVGNTDVHLFELAACFPAGAGPLPEEHVELALVSTDDLPSLRGALEAAVERVAPGAAIDVRPAASPAAHLNADAAAEVLLGGAVIGTMGMVADKVREHYGLEKPIAAAAVTAGPIFDAAQLVRTYAPVPRFPAVRRDLSVIVDEPATWRQLADTVAGVPQPLRHGIQYVTTYRGKPVPDGRKSVTMTLTYRHADRTLRGEEVDEQTAQIVAAMKTRFKAELRT